MINSLIDANFKAHAISVPEQNTEMKVFQGTNLSYVDSGFSCDTFNILHIHNGQQITFEELKEAIDYYRSSNLDFCLWVNEDNKSEKLIRYFKHLDLTVQNQEIGMLLELADYTSIVNTSHQNILVVDTPESLAEYANVLASNWSPPDPDVIGYYRKTVAQYLDQFQGITLLIYKYKGQALGTVELFPTDDKTIGIYGLATLANHRGQGIGSALMTYALNLANDQGYQQVVLQASADGEGIYKKLGFTPYTTYFEFA